MTTKLNYRKYETGARSTITLSYALINAWISVMNHRRQFESREDAIRELIASIEEMRQEGPGTFVSRVEAALLTDIEQEAASMAMMVKRMEGDVA